jgi:hypothetical protein
MLERARAACADRLGPDAARVELRREDVMALSLPDASVDAVVCNRLLHHYPSPEVRRRALGELARVSRGPVVVSFFCSFALSALKFFVVNRLRGVTPTDRVPIPLDEMRRDVEAVGLTVEAVLPVRWGVSPQTYVKAVRPARA